MASLKKRCFRTPPPNLREPTPEEAYRQIRAHLKDDLPGQTRIPAQFQPTQANVEPARVCEEGQRPLTGA